MASENTVAAATRVSNWTMATGSQPAKRMLRRVVFVSREPDRQVLETVLDAGDYDIVFVESIAGAYSQIKRVMPDLVVVCLEIDDLDGFQVLSMLKLDRATAGIPVVTYTTTTPRETRGFEDDPVEPYELDVFSHVVAVSMN